MIALIGGVALVFGPSMARARISLHYSSEELHNPSNPRHRRVQLATIATAGLNALLGVAWLYFSIHALVGGVLAPSAAILAGVGAATSIEYRKRPATWPSRTARTPAHAFKPLAQERRPISVGGW